ncbi:MAG: oligosaccharide flippase family protein [Nitrosomonadales bacterium]|nr:oligosaccharide flippase family protein [Nitrosomonadales bacterium]
MTIPEGQAQSQHLFSKLKRLLSNDPLAIVRRLLANPTVRATLVFGLSGLAFALGNLFLARTMSVEDYGKFALAIALFNVFSLLTPLGIDQALLRHRIDPGPRLLVLICITGTIIGLAVGTVYWLYTDVQIENIWMLALSIVSGGIVAILIALARALHREHAALLLATVASWILLVIGIVSFFIPMHLPLIPITLFAVANLLAAIVGWLTLCNAHRVVKSERVSIPWAESFSLLGIAAIGTLVLQLERLIIPFTIGLQELAVFSVLASVAIFPFRLLTASAGFSLVPKLRAASDRRQKLRMIGRELLSIGLLAFVSTIGIVILAPIVTDIFTAGRYQISFSLALAACVNGYSKIMQTIPRALITACGNDHDITRLNRLGWVGLFTSVLGGFLGANWGLEGLLYGVAIGSMAGTLPAIILAKGKLNEPAIAV